MNLIVFLLIFKYGIHSSFRSDYTFVFAPISNSYSEDELYFSSPILVYARLILNNKSFFLIFLLFQKGFPNLCKKVLFFVTEMKISFVYAGKWEVNLKEKCPCLQKETKKYFCNITPQYRSRHDWLGTVGDSLANKLENMLYCGLWFY